MKTIITEITDGQGTVYRTWAEVTPCDRPQDLVCLRFSSTWTGAKNPQDAQVKAEFFLDPESRHALIKILEAAQ